MRDNPKNPIPDDRMAHEMQSTLRLAVVGTPRSGNTWFRRLMVTAYDLQNDQGREYAVHNPLDVDWDNAGNRYIVQVHIPCEQRWIEHFQKYGVKILVPFRHPFDVLISILHYATKVDATHLWLDSLGGNENSIKGLHPCHPAFVEYARSERAKCLFDVSTKWSRLPGTVPFHYEDLVARPDATLAQIERAIGTPFVASRDSIIALNTLDHLRNKDGIAHHWQGKPGQWKRLLTKDVADAIAEAYRPLLEAYHYGHGDDASPSLTAEEAHANYLALG